MTLANAASADDDLTQPAECLLRVEGVELISGPCLTGAIGADRSVAVRSPDGEYAARVVVKSPSVADAYWNGAPFAANTDTLIGTVVLIGACWASDKMKLCVTK
jgi:hypothetical protein